MNGIEAIMSAKAVSSLSENTLRACDHGDE